VALVTQYDSEACTTALFTPNDLAPSFRISVVLSNFLPFEFVVTGKPVSHQTKDRQRLQAWKQKVREVAQACWLAPSCLGESVQVTITHYYDAAPGNEHEVPDSDNIVKPVRDALNGLIYVDDYQVTDFVSRRRSLNGSFRIRGMSPVLAEGFCSGEEFLHIRVEAAPDPNVLN
jgi:crossover junction endodeoxyribonuclease RusA